MKPGDKYGCLVVLGSPPIKTNHKHKFYQVKCARCGAIKCQRADRVRKAPEHCGKGECRTINGVYIGKRRRVERHLWAIIKEMKKDRPTWYYICNKLKDDILWESTGLQKIDELTMRKWYCRMNKIFSKTAKEN